MSSPGGRLARSDLHQLVFPAAQTNFLAVDQCGFPVGVRMSGLEVIFALAGLAAADDGSIAIRITKEPFSQRLCRQFRKAIVSTSANISGNAAPHNFSEISDEIKNAVDYIVTARRDEIKESLPSSIIKLEADGTIKIIRE